MSRYFLTGLSVEGFRGINNEGDPLAIKLKKDKVNSIYATNGVGKSSLFDAVYYAITGKLPKLEALHNVERPQDYYVNRFHSQMEGTVELLFESDDPTAVAHTVKIVRKADGTRTVTSPSHKDPEAFLAAMDNSFALLDYHTFNTFINNSPLERGRSFSTLLGLDAYSDFRQTLKTVTDTRALRGDLDLSALETRTRAYNDAATTAQVKAGNAYKDVTGKDFEDVAKIDEYGGEVLGALKQVDLLKEKLEVDSLDDVDFDAIIETIKAAEGGKEKDRFVELARLIAVLDDVGEISEDIATERTELAQKVVELTKLYAATAGKSRRAIYDAADHLLTSDGWHDEKKCPLCESELKQTIQEIVNEQQQQYGQVDEKIQEIKEYWLSSELRKRCLELEGQIGKDIPDDEKHFSTTDSKLSNGTAKAEDIEQLLEYYDKLEARLAKAKKTFKEEHATLSKKLPKSLVQLTEQVEHARQFKDNTAEYKNNVKQYVDEKKKLDIRTRWQAFICDAEVEYAKAEAELSRQKLLMIEADYKAMFAEVMKTGDVVPNLTRDETSEHLYVQLEDFRGQHDLSAKPLLSESFRNALAISVYLSAAMKHTDAPRFIILDDISSSFDAGHELMLMEFVRTKLQNGANVNGLQFIILTHEERLQNFFERLASSGDAHHQVIEGSPPYNLTMRAKNASQLRANAVTPLTAGQVDNGKFWVRPYLECKLMEVIRNLNISVPLDFAVKDRHRMVQNCLDAIQKDVNLHEAAGTLVMDATQRTDMRNTHLPALVANWVTHFETGSGAGVTAAVLLSVLDSVDQFTECFKYDYTDPVTRRVSRKYYKNLRTK